MEKKELIPRSGRSLRDWMGDEWFMPWRQTLEQEFDSLARRFGLPGGDEGFFAKEFVPAVNVMEKDNAIHVEVDLPGLDPKEVEVTVTDDVLTIRGERKSEAVEEHQDYYRRERRVGAFQRSIRLPARVMADKVDARFQHGLLKLVLPVHPDDRGRTLKIPIKAG
jgi:HSP20 family protein